MWSILWSLVSVLAPLQGDTITDRIHNVEEVEVSRRASWGLAHSTMLVQSRSEQQFEQLGMTGLADAVKTFSGVTVRDYGGIGGMKTVSLRNIGTHHTAVSYDGITLSNTETGQIDLSKYSLDNVLRLTLSIGQEADQMQTARHYASAGVLSIESFEPQPTDGKTWGLRAKVRGGAFGMVNPSLRLWSKAGQNTSFALVGSYMRADGTYPFTLINGIDKTREKRYNSDIRAYQGEANLYHTLTNGARLHAKAYYYQSERGLPGSIILYSKSATERLWDEHFFSQATYRQHFSERWQLRARLKYDHSWSRYEDVNVKYEGGKRTDIARQNEFYASATLGWAPLESLTIALAQDAAVNTLSNNIETQPDPTRYTSLTALSARLRQRRFTLDANLLGTFITEHRNSKNRPPDRKRLSPSLSFSYQLDGKEELFARLLVKSTFRVPTFTDMYYLHIGNSNLRPEKAVEYTGGLTWNHSFGRGMAFHASIDGYLNLVSDKIVCFPTTYVWRMVNFGRARITGIDLSVNADAPLGKHVSLSIMGTYNYQHAVDRSDKERSSYNQQLPYSPRHTDNLSVMACTPYVNIGYSMNACGVRYSMIQNTSEYRMKPYAEHNLTVSRDIRMKAGTLNLSGSLLNFTNQQYEIIKYYPMPGRSWQLAATFTL